MNIVRFVPHQIYPYPLWFEKKYPRRPIPSAHPGGTSCVATLFFMDLFDKVMSFMDECGTETSVVKIEPIVVHGGVLTLMRVSTIRTVARAEYSGGMTWENLDRCNIKSMLMKLQKTKDDSRFDRKHHATQQVPITPVTVEDRSLRLRRV